MTERRDLQVITLIRAERERTDPPEATKARVLARIGKTLALPPASLLAPAKSRGPAPRTKALGRAAKMIALTLIGAAGGLALATRLSSTAPVAATGVAPFAAPVTMEPKSLGDDPTPGVARSIPEAHAQSSALVAASATTGTAAKTGGPESRSGSQPPIRANLGVERKLLDQARTRLLSGDPSEALAIVAKHGARFPQGILAEEREALRVESLAAAGRPRDACIAAAIFREAYPGSLLGRAVDGACPESNP